MLLKIFFQIIQYLVSYILKETCYLDYDETSEFAPFVKSLFCTQYILIDEMIYAIIIISLSMLLVYSMFIEKNDKLQKIKWTGKEKWRTQRNNEEFNTIKFQKILLKLNQKLINQTNIKIITI